MAASSDDYDLERFVQAQSGVYDQAYSELSAGRKRSHWMWFVFPQIEGLGSSHMAQRYAVGSAAEASAYLAHPVLGPRLERCTEAMLSVKASSAHDILGYPDDLKFHSSLTLFASVSKQGSVFHRALKRFFDGMADEKTLSRLSR